MRTLHGNQVTRLLAGLVCAGALVLISACSSSADVATTESASEATTARSDSGDLSDALLEPGVLTVATFDSSPPSAFYSSDRRLIGWEVELMGEIADRLGLEVQFSGGPFDSVIPAVAEGGADTGIASMFDTRARQLDVDFVDYFTGGTSWAAARDSDFDPRQPCGTDVGAVLDTAQYSDYLPRMSNNCIQSGLDPITVVGYESITRATEDVAARRIDAMVGDDPVVAYLVSNSYGRLVLADSYVEPQRYGIAVTKGNRQLRDAVLSALEDMRADGSYQRLLGRWGVEEGAVDSFSINGSQTQAR